MACGQGQPPLKASVVLLAHVVQQQSLEVPLGVKDADNGLVSQDFAVDQTPHQ